jgi:hypothetical protein
MASRPRMLRHRTSVSGIGAGVLGVEAALQLAARRDRQFEPLELHRVVHARLEFGYFERDHARFSRLAARGELVEGATGEHIGEPAVAPKLELRAHLHHAVKVVVAGERSVSRRAVRRACAGSPEHGQRKDGRENVGSA